MKSTLGPSEVPATGPLAPTSLTTIRALSRPVAEQDISSLDALARANIDLAAKTIELSEANANLESFVYSVSHDLRSPLRALSGFSEALLEDYGDSLDEIGRDYAERIRRASQKMSTLIDALLHLSRISKQELVFHQTDLSLLVTEIAEELKQRDPERVASFEIQEEVTILADKSLLEVALRNLLENAWKFTGKVPSTHIRFSAVRRPSELECSIQDNGAGFDTSYSEKLFKPFQRLHRTEDFPGTGIGLATVKRVIEKSGGRVWAESELDGGATFHFTLPQTKEE